MIRIFGINISTDNEQYPSPLWHDKYESPSNNRPVVWVSYKMPRERGIIEVGRYDKSYDCFFSTANYCISRDDIKKWVYVEELINYVRNCTI